jgi:hypothetical protein
MRHVQNLETQAYLVTEHSKRQKAHLQRKNRAMQVGPRTTHLILSPSTFKPDNRREVLYPTQPTVPTSARFG